MMFPREADSGAASPVLRSATFSKTTEEPMGEVCPPPRARNQAREPRRRDTRAGGRGRGRAQVTRESGSRRQGRPAAGRTERKGTNRDEGRRFIPTVNDRNRYARPVTPARACPRPRAGKPGSSTAVAPDPAVAPALQRWQRSGKPRLDPGSGAGVTVVGAARPLLSRGQAGRGATVGRHRP